MASLCSRLGSSTAEGMLGRRRIPSRRRRNASVRGMFAIAVRFDLKDEDAARAFDSLVTEMLDGIKELEPETLVYAVHTVEDAPLSRVFYEVYASREAHAYHEANPSTHRLLSQVEVFTTSTRVEFLGAPTGKLF